MHRDVERERENDERQKPHRYESEEVLASAATEEGTVPQGHYFYGDTPAIATGKPGRGNLPTRHAALQRLQQTYGNRALRRYLRPSRRAAKGQDETPSTTETPQPDQQS